MKFDDLEKQPLLGVTKTTYGTPCLVCGTYTYWTRNNLSLCSTECTDSYPTYKVMSTAFTTIEGNLANISFKLDTISSGLASVSGALMSIQFSLQKIADNLTSNIADKVMAELTMKAVSS
jgi:hypothetical protein